MEIGKQHAGGKTRETIIEMVSTTRSKAVIVQALRQLVLMHPDLFVVLVTAGCSDLQELKEAAADRKKRTPEIAQLLHLLDGLNGYARQLGVRLIVRDLPYPAH